MKMFWSLVATIAFTAFAVGAENPPAGMVDVFVGGQEGFPTYRIPAIVRALDGTLLAFAEGRASKRDQAHNQLVLKISRDGGRSWGSLAIIAADGTNSLNNPTAVVLRGTGRVLLVYQCYRGRFAEFSVVPGYEGEAVCRTWIIYSDDQGRTWSSPREITRGVKRPTEATSSAAGPGIGVEMAGGPHPGRVIIPFNEGPPGHWHVYAAYSDDQGATWHRGAAAPETAYTGANEVQMLELPGGRLLLNARNQAGSHQRRVAASDDGGETWSPLVDDPAVVEPRCQAAFLRHPVSTNATEDVLLFSNPASPTKRENGRLRVSRDRGRTWSAGKLIYAGSFAYSGLVSLDPATVGCLFERDNYQRISFVPLPVNDP